MAANLISAIESVERLKDGFAGLFAISDAIKAGALDEQTLVERRKQLTDVEKKIEAAKAEEATLLADIEQHRVDDAAATKEAAAKAKQLLDDAYNHADSLVVTAQKDAEIIKKEAAHEHASALEQYAAIMAEKQAALADLDRQVGNAADILKHLDTQVAEAEKRLAQIKAAAAAVAA